MKISCSRPALARLLDAYERARAFEQNPWEWALPFPVLQREAKLTQAHLGGLLLAGYAEVANETTGPQDQTRTFQPLVNLVVGERTCVVLTTQGAAWARAWLSGPGLAPNRVESSGEAAPSPRWDKARRELWYGGKLIKQYRRRDPDQERILDELQESGWPARIDDPLPPEPGRDRKAKLNDAIKGLNRGHKEPGLRFHGDGTGQGIRWDHGK